ncbi:MAG: hypothetical protein JO340_17495 [Acidobacteriaceae bacterium]|nr:hypothetical protein [Acidobacteriaceae bacterium]
MIAALPPEMLLGATLRENEYGWNLSAFPAALAAAQRFDLACLGGQIEFRVDGSIAEAYWCNADSSERIPEEPWREYVKRSCKEVSDKFTELVRGLDVPKLLAEWPRLSALLQGRDPEALVVFVAYFVTEQEYVAL